MPKVLRIESLRLAVSNAVPAIIMFAVLLIALCTINAAIADPWLKWLGWFAAVTCIVRIVALVIVRRAVNTAGIDRHDLRRIERIFAGTYILFAAALGTFGARVLALPFPNAHVLTLTMLVGYAAGAAATMDLRPMISVPSILLATVPTAIVAIGRADPFYMATGVIMISFVIGGCFTIMHRVRLTNTALLQRDIFMEMAHLDDLTRLPNRVEMHRRFSIAMAEPRQGPIAVHYVDLNGFNRVNDEFGHAVGDETLKEVATRLSRTIGADSMIARLGGDEFGIVQFNIRDERDVDAMRVQLRTALMPHFSTPRGEIEISASFGSAIGQRGACNLEDLLRKADSEQSREKKMLAILGSLPAGTIRPAGPGLASAPPDRRSI